MIEDHDKVLIRLPDGEITRANPIPHDVPVDLVLLRLVGIDIPLPRRDDAVPERSERVRDVGRERERAEHDEEEEVGHEEVYLLLVQL